MEFSIPVAPVLVQRRYVYESSQIGGEGALLKDRVDQASIEEIHQDGLLSYVKNAAFPDGRFWMISAIIARCVWFGWFLHTRVPMRE